MRDILQAWGAEMEIETKRMGKDGKPIKREIKPDEDQEDQGDQHDKRKS